MARPLPIEFSDAFYHLTARGDGCEAIYEDDEDRRAFLDIFATVSLSSSCDDVMPTG